MTIVLDVVGRVLAQADERHIVVVRSTLPLGGPAALAELAAAGPGGTRGAAIVTNPEFMREGNALADFAEPNRCVVGWLRPSDRPAAERIAALYAPLGAPTIVADARSAALLKLATNAFLAMKIGFANELARLADALGAEIDVVVDGMGLDPRIGRGFLSPGPGYGGSCLPEQAGAIGREVEERAVPSELLTALGRINDTHQRAIVDRLGDRLDGLAGRRVAILGLAFKAGTDDVRHAPGLAIAARLRERGATVAGHDPQAGGTAAAADPALAIAADPVGAAADADAVVIATEWPEYRSLDWTHLARAMRGRLVLDLRAIADAEAVREAGLDYLALGRPGVTAPADEAVASDPAVPAEA
jgi:UDPglucose 6-dehydrogenase